MTMAGAQVHFIEDNKTLLDWARNVLVRPRGARAVTMQLGERLHAFGFEVGHVGYYLVREGEDLALLLRYMAGGVAQLVFLSVDTAELLELFASVLGSR